MDIEEIHEPIGVVCECTGGRIDPLRFSWGTRDYEIAAVNSRWTDRAGDGYRLCYSVQVEAETYLIHFASLEIQWWLDKVIVI